MSASIRGGLACGNVVLKADNHIGHRCAILEHPRLTLVISPAASVRVTVGEALEVGEGLTVPEGGVLDGGVPKEEYG